MNSIWFHSLTPPVNLPNIQTAFRFFALLSSISLFRKSEMVRYTSHPNFSAFLKKWNGNDLPSALLQMNLDFHIRKNIILR